MIDLQVGEYGWAPSLGFVGKVKALHAPGAYKPGLDEAVVEFESGDVLIDTTVEPATVEMWRYGNMVEKTAITMLEILYMAAYYDGQPRPWSAAIVGGTIKRLVTVMMEKGTRLRKGG